MQFFCLILPGLQPAPAELGRVRCLLPGPQPSGLRCASLEWGRNQRYPPARLAVHITAAPDLSHRLVPDTVSGPMLPG